MGSSGGSTQTTTSLPPDYAQPYHQYALAGAQQVANTPYQAYPYAQIANFTPEQQTGMNLTTQRALQGSPVGNAAQAEAQKTLSGGYLDPTQNTALQQAMNYGQGQVMKNYGAQLGRNFGNSGVNQEVGDAMGRVSASLYDQERNRMIQNQALAPSLANMDYADLGALMGVGDTKQAFNQQVLQMGQNEYNRALGWPNQSLATMLSAVQGTGGYGQQTAPNPYQSSRAAGALGGAATGAAIGAQTANPYGVAIGAGIGALGGLIM